MSLKPGLCPGAVSLVELEQGRLDVTGVHRSAHRVDKRKLSWVSDTWDDPGWFGYIDTSVTMEIHLFPVVS